MKKKEKKVKVSKPYWWTEEIKPPRFEQLVNEDLASDLACEPPTVRNFVTSNFVQRSVAYLYGWNNAKPQRIKVASDGAIYTTSSPTRYSAYEVNPSSATPDYVTISASNIITETFNDIVSQVMVFAKDNDIYVEISQDGVTFGPKFVLRGSVSQYLSLALECKALRFSNVVTDGTANGSYLCIGLKI